jgi:hypothetical protein
MTSDKKSPHMSPKMSLGVEVDDGHSRKEGVRQYTVRDRKLSEEEIQRRYEKG